MEVTEYVMPLCYAIVQGCRQSNCTLGENNNVADLRHFKGIVLSLAMTCRPKIKFLGRGEPILLFDHVQSSVTPIVPKSIVVSKTFKFHLGDKFKVTIQSGEPHVRKST